MKAIVLRDFGDTDQFILQHLPMPDRKAHEVLVEIKAAAFNPIDYQMRLGLGESKLLKSQILGREFSGIVAEPGNSKFQKGDAVFAYCGSLASNGSYATHISIPHQLLSYMPANLNFAQAAAIPMAGLTALQCVERLKAQPDDTVFIAGGAGSVGLMAIQLLLASGVKRIITTAGNEQSRASLIKLGLPDSSIVDYRQAGLLQQLVEKNNGELFGHCIDIVGGAMSELCANLVAVNGSYADIAAMATAAARTALFDKATTIYNIANYAMAAYGDTQAHAYYGEKLSYLAGLFESGKLKPPAILDVGDLNIATVAAAHAMLETNTAEGRKLVMQLSD